MALKKSSKQVLKTLQILTSDPNVKAILVNIFGEIVNFTTIADGIVNATKTIGLKVPLVVRLKGTNVDAAKKILEESGLKIESVHELEEAAKKTINYAIERPNRFNGCLGSMHAMSTLIFSVFSSPLGRFVIWLLYRMYHVKIMNNTKHNKM
ncbi:succinate--CoA ligase [GDP-forming] subunit beta, mitochondrial [Aedes aegypti]|uniref:ATP-citrate synthase/succinyl-CoA ligase C-terminal domain-containing protein n=1 Tax=Aedes aegypti TaxID=7159 RepID=A0A6I8TZK9_AEDAE|nr:succinate--CoA ligase [GDP-forming] subunit beta, mitochondrial [Aedes aegypti]